MRLQMAMVAMAGMAALAACGGGGGDAGGKFSPAGIKQQCIASENDWVAVYAKTGRDSPIYRQNADKVIADCCPKMAAAAKSLSAKQLEYLWYDMGSLLGATLPETEVQANAERASEIMSSLSYEERREALAPRMEVLAACKREIGD